MVSIQSGKNGIVCNSMAVFAVTVYSVFTIPVNIYLQKYPIHWCKSYGYELRLGYAWLRLKGQNQAIFIHVRLQTGEVRLKGEPNLEEGLQA